MSKDTQKSLPEIFNEIEQRARDATTGQYGAVKQLADNDVPALVKALRKQQDALDHMVNLSSRILRESHRERTKSEITAILNGEKQ